MKLAGGVENPYLDPHYVAEAKKQATHMAQNSARRRYDEGFKVGACYGVFAGAILGACVMIVGLLMF